MSENMIIHQHRQAQAWLQSCVIRTCWWGILAGLFLVLLVALFLAGVGT